MFLKTWAGTWAKGATQHTWVQQLTKNQEAFLGLFGHELQIGVKPNLIGRETQILLYFTVRDGTLFFNADNNMSNSQTCCMNKQRYFYDHVDPDTMLRNRSLLWLKSVIRNFDRNVYKTRLNSDIILPQPNEKFVGAAMHYTNLRKSCWSRFVARRGWSISTGSWNCEIRTLPESTEPWRWAPACYCIS